MEEIKVGDPIQELGEVNNPNGDILHTDIDLSPSIDDDRVLTEEDLQETTIETEEK